MTELLTSLILDIILNWVCVTQCARFLDQAFISIQVEFVEIADRMDNALSNYNRIVHKVVNK